MFDCVLSMPLLPAKNKEIIVYYEKLKTLWALFADEPLRGESLHFTAQSPRVRGTDLIDPGWMKG